MIKIFLAISLIHSLAFCTKIKLIDTTSLQPIKNASIINGNSILKSDENGTFAIQDTNTTYHIKAIGFKPLSFRYDENLSAIELEPIHIKALYLTFWGASNKSKTLKKILNIIDKTQINAIIMDVKNEYGSTSFLTSFKQANSYGAHKQRTNRDIKKFIQTMHNKGIYVIARLVTFKDELQASNNPDYAIRKTNGKIWRNSDKMAWVDPFDKRSHDYTIAIAKEAAKVGFDEINFDYIRFPAKKDLALKKPNTQKNRIETINSFLDEAREALEPYGVFISVDTYGQIAISKDDTGIGQTVKSLAKHTDYLCPMLYPSGFARGSFGFKKPPFHPYMIIDNSLKLMTKKTDAKKIRPWIQGFRDYVYKKHYNKKEIQAQIKACNDNNTSGWMVWSPSSKYKLIHYLNEPTEKNEDSIIE